MYISNKTASAETTQKILDELKRRNVRHTAKKSVNKNDVLSQLGDANSKQSSHVFGVALDAVRSSLLECCEGHFYIPSIVADLIVALKPFVTVEGLFRKAQIDRTGQLGDVPLPPIDVASLLKSFLRSIPEALIRTDVCDTLYKCKLLSVADMLETIQLSILLLPVAHIHLLHILLEFLNFVSRHHTLNRMDTNNLAIVMAPSIFSPTSVKSEARCGHFIKILEMMIENSKVVGQIPTCIWEKINNGTLKAEVNAAEADRKLQKKKRRSSFTSVIAAGLRKIRRASYGDPMDTNNAAEVKSTEGAVATVKPSLLIFPRTKTEATSIEVPPPLPPKAVEPVARTAPVLMAKKRKFDINPTVGLSNKIRQNVINSMPSSSITPTPSKRMRSLTMANAQCSSATDNAENEQPTTSGANPDRSKDDLLVINKKLMRDVAFLEKRLNRLENFVAYQICGDTPANTVQDAYEKTLEEAAMIDTTSSQQLTDRLSREMKIRQEKNRPKVIRSPSARKIGTIRRRSRDSFSSDYKQTYNTTDNF